MDGKSSADGGRYADVLACMMQARHGWLYFKETLPNDHVGRLALIHPRWYVKDGIKDVRGSEKFPRDAVIDSESCESVKVWGYECPFEDAPLEADHWFPWSLGGPTINANMIALCGYHNQAKGCDWHVQSLKTLVFEQWFIRQVDLVADCLDDEALNGRRK